MLCITATSHSQTASRRARTRRALGPSRAVGLVAVLWLALCPAFASAEFIVVDLFTPGDVRVVRDTESGLDWLRFNSTAGLSMAAIQSGAGGWIAGGWRYATRSEVCEMVTHFVTGPPNASCIPSYSTSQVQGLLTLFGTLDVQSAGSKTVWISEGYFVDDTPGNPLQGTLVIAHEEPFFMIGTVLGVLDDAIPITSTTGQYSSPGASLLVRVPPAEVPALGSAGRLAVVGTMIALAMIRSVLFQNRGRVGDAHDDHEVRA